MKEDDDDDEEQEEEEEEAEEENVDNIDEDELDEDELDEEVDGEHFTYPNLKTFRGVKLSAEEKAYLLKYESEHTAKQIMSKYFKFLLYMCFIKIFIQNIFNLMLRWGKPSKPKLDSWANPQSRRKSRRKLASTRIWDSRVRKLIKRPRNTTWRPSFENTKSEKI